MACHALDCHGPILDTERHVGRREPAVDVLVPLLGAGRRGRGLVGSALPHELILEVELGLRDAFAARGHREVATCGTLPQVTCQASIGLDSALACAVVLLLVKMSHSKAVLCGIEARGVRAGVSVFLSCPTTVRIGGPC